MHFELSNPTQTIINECGDKRLKRKDVALTYAIALANDHAVPVDWVLANRAITLRWSTAALKWIKERAWKIFEGKIKPL